MGPWHQEIKTKSFGVNFTREVFSVQFAGDLTHAIYSDTRFSRQYEVEWREYHRVLTESGVLNKTTWLDIRGNHGELLGQCASMSLRKPAFLLLTVFGKIVLTQFLNVFSPQNDGDSKAFHNGTLQSNYPRVLFQTRSTFRRATLLSPCTGAFRVVNS